MWRRTFGAIFRSRRDTTPVHSASVGTPFPRRDWATLPPLDPLGHESFVLSSRIDEFSRSLVERHRGVRHVAPLGHEVVQHAPRGVVTGLARAVEAVPERGPVLDQPLRRRAQRQQRGRWRPVFRWTSREPAASPPPPDSPRAGNAVPPPVSRSTAPDPSPVTELAGPEAVTSSPSAPVPPVDPDAPVRDLASPPQGRGVTAAGQREDPPSRSVVRHAPRVLRSVEPSRPGQLPSSRASRPLDLPLRPLAVQRVAVTDRTADDHEVESPLTPSGTSMEAQAEPVIGTPDASTRDETAPPTEAARPDGAPAPDVRPTIGGPGTPPPAGTSSPQVPATTGEDLPWDVRARPGVGSPLDSLPPTARRVHSSTDPATSRPAQGPGVAMQRKLQPSTPTAPLPPAAGPSARPPGDADREPAPARPRPDLPLPPVVARRLASTGTPAEPEPDAPDADASAAPVLPLASLRQPLSGPTPTAGDIGDVGQADGWWRPDRTPGPAGPGSAPRPSSRGAPDGGVRTGHRTMNGPLHRSAEPSESSQAVPIRWRTASEVEASHAGPRMSGSRSLRGRRGGSGRSARGRENSIVAHEGVGPTPPRGADAPRSGQAVPRGVGRGSHPSRPLLRSLDRSTQANGGPAPGRGLAHLPSDALEVPLVRDFVASRGTMSGGSSGASAKSDMPLAPTVQREREERPRESTSSHAEPPPVQRREAAQAPIAGRPDVEPSSEGAMVDREELFRELYPRMRDELRWELRVQRERAGLLADPL